MLTSLDAGIRIKPRLDPNMIYCLTSTMLSGRRVTWRDMVEAFSGLPSYVALLLLDDSKASKALRQIVADRYIDLDRSSGDSLVILTTVPPPPDWFRHKLARLRRLPPWAQEFHQSEIAFLGTAEGDRTARLSSSALARELVENNGRCPALVFFRLVASATEPGTFDVQSEVFDCNGLTTPERLLAAIEHLAAIAKSAEASGEDALDMAKAAFAITDPRSLRWRNAVGATLDTATSLFDWFKRAKELEP